MIRRKLSFRISVSMLLGWMICLVPLASPVGGQENSRVKPGQRKDQWLKDTDLPYPPTLPGGVQQVSDQSAEFLKPPADLQKDVLVATEVPRVDFLFYPGQNYPGKPWSNWGDGCVADGKYYSAIGDHHALGRGAAELGAGTALVYEYDPQTRNLKSLVNVSRFLDLPGDHYAPGKIHSRIDQGRDGWLYYATHRGSPKAASDTHHYVGDWILRTDPKSSTTEIVIQAPVPKHSIPNSVLDPERMIFYGGTAPGPDAELQEIQFFAYDLAGRKMLYSGSGGPARYMILARSTGRVYFVPGNADGELLRYDPRLDQPPVPIGQKIGIRAATAETAEGKIYSASSGQQDEQARLWEFDTRTEKVKPLGPLAVGSQAYVASLDVDPTGRFLYYVPGAHGGGFQDGSPLVQYDVRKGTRKVIAFLHPFYEKKYGVVLKGTYSTAVSETGDRVYITWNASRGTKAWDCCALSVVHVPESER